MERSYSCRVIAAALLYALTAQASATEITEMRFTRLVDTATPRPGTSATFTRFTDIGLDDGFIKFRSPVENFKEAVYINKPDGDLIELSRGLSEMGCSAVDGYSQVNADDMRGDEVWISARCFYFEIMDSYYSLFIASEDGLQELADPFSLISSDMGPITLIGVPTANAARTLVTGITQQGAAIFDLDVSGELFASSLIREGSPIPDSAALFNSFNGIALDDAGNFAFSGSKAPTSVNVAGIYQVANDAANSQPVRVADSTMLMPGSGYRFNALGFPAIHEDHVVFVGTHFINNDIFKHFDGIYSRKGAQPLRRVADESTAIPGTNGLFFGFSGLTVYQDIIIFSAYGQDALSAIYADTDGELRRLIGPGDTLDGKMVTAASTGDEGRDGNSLAIAVTFTDGITAIYRLDLTVQQTVAIDIKPGDAGNAINPASNGVLPVAILTTRANHDAGDFDALQVDPASLRFGSTGASIAHRNAHVEDVDGDNDADLLTHFRTADAGVLCSDTEIELTGMTYSGQAIRGSDAIATVECEAESCH